MAQRPRATEIFSNWYHFNEGLQASPMELYAAIEEAVHRRNIPDIKISRVDWREGGILSAKREYLRVRRKELVFDICGAPFGTGFFVSWWLGELPSGFWALVARIPGFGLLLHWAFRRETYFKIDTALMFQESIRGAVNEVYNQLTQTKGVRALTELEEKPILKRLAASAA